MMLRSNDTVNESTNPSQGNANHTNEILERLSATAKRNRKEVRAPSSDSTEPPLEDIFWYLLEDEIIPFSEDDYQANLSSDTILLNWIVPPMGAGSGGHLSLFRFMSGLETRGFHSKIYLYGEKAFTNDSELTSFIRKHYEHIHPSVECYSSIMDIGYAHLTIATGWQTAYFLRRFNNTLEKVYFVQDFEPWFYPHGSMYHFSEDTYSFGFSAITAGEWLSELLSQEYKMPATSFSFAANKDIYYPHEKNDSTPRVFFYARPATPRRDFELGMLALAELCQRMPEVVVEFAGGDLREYVIPFKHNCHGIMSLEDLSALYSQCTLSLILSSTNLSLAPVEAMASGSVVVCSDGPNSTWLVNDSNGIIVSEDPKEIAIAMEQCLKDELLLKKKREEGIVFAAKTSWEQEFDKVANALREKLVRE